jgi:prefoldin alpha subunit
MAGGNLRASEVQAKVRQYELFIEGTLKRDLARCINAQDKVQQLHNDYSALRQSILTLQKQHEAERAAATAANNSAASISPMHTMVNLGSEFYLRAVVPDPTRVFVDVGLGFHVELQLQEALDWIALKLPSLETKVQTHRDQAAMVQSKIKVVYEGISELMQLQQQQKPQRQVF